MFKSVVTATDIAFGRIVPDEYKGNTVAAAALVTAIAKVLGTRVRITSGYRPATANEKAKGATGSGHLIGAGVDFALEGLTTAQVAARVLELEKIGEMPNYGELIFYPFGDNHFHITLPGVGGNREKLVKLSEDGYAVFNVSWLSRFPGGATGLSAGIVLLVIVAVILVVKHSQGGA